MSPRIARTAVGLVALAAPALSAPLAPAVGEAERGRALWKEGRVEEAEKCLAGAVAANAADVPARLALGELQAWDGRAEEALATWAASPGGKDADVPLLLAAADLHLQRAADGPLVKRYRGSQRIEFRPGGGDEAAAEAFVKAEHAAAEAALRKAVALRPADPGVVLPLADLLEGTGRAAQSVPFVEVVAKKEPKNVLVLVAWGSGLAASGKTVEGLAKIEQAVKLAPRSPEAHAALSAIHHAAGKADLATTHRKKSQIFAWLPASSRLEYSDALWEQARALTADSFWVSAEESAKRLAEKKAIVDGLLAKKDEPSYDLLGVICRRHCCHGELENAAYAALEARGAASLPILRELLAEGEATCTVGAAARGLARMKDAASFDAVAARLATDVDPAFPMDIAGALVAFGDPRAVPILVAAARMDAPPLPPPAKPTGGGRTVVVGGPPGTEDGMPDGSFAARIRAVLALAEFDLPAARTALASGTAHADLGPFCHAALWKLDKDEKAHGRFVAKAVLAGEGLVPAVLGPWIARIDHPSAKEIHSQWRKAEEDKRKAEEKKK